eukprot:g5752.t1
MASQSIYLDYNATTPIRKEVGDAMIPYLREQYGNPSSTYSLGRAAKDAIQQARKQVAKIINASPDEIFFTSGSTESINWAIKGCAWAKLNDPDTENLMSKPHIITCASEHIATLEVCKFLAKNGFELTVLPVGKDGLLQAKEVAAAVRPETILVSIMRANNETGVLQPLGEISRACKEKNKNVIVHTDASQAVGKIHVNVEELNVDMLTIAGHKLYAPKGVGALYVRQNAVTGRKNGKKGVFGLMPLLHGGGQEGGVRAGTENVLLDVGLGKACEIAHETLNEFCEKMRKLRKRFLDGLKNAGVDIFITGPDDDEKRLPNTCHFLIKGGISGGEVLEKLQGKIMASAQSACHSGATGRISHVLKAMNIDEKLAGGAMRISLGVYTTEEDVDRAVDEISKCIE